MCRCKTWAILINGGNNSKKIRSVAVKGGPLGNWDFAVDEASSPRAKGVGGGRWDSANQWVNAHESEPDARYCLLRKWVSVSSPKLVCEHIHGQTWSWTSGWVGGPSCGQECQVGAGSVLVLGRPTSPCDEGCCYWVNFQACPSTWAETLSPWTGLQQMDRPVLLVTTGLCWLVLDLCSHAGGSWAGASATFLAALSRKNPCYSWFLQRAVKSHEAAMVSTVKSLV